MKLLVVRMISRKDFTIGCLYRVVRQTTADPTYISTERHWMCFTMEDEYRTKKVYGETRIPVGEYEIKLRTVGRHHARYRKKYPRIHRGMLWLQDVPNFEYILIHTGNTDDDTAGCLLVGQSADPKRGIVGRSVRAYVEVYPVIARAIEAGERVTIRFEDFDTPPGARQ